MSYNGWTNYYNGWTNYQTWRAHLELVDSDYWDEVGTDGTYDSAEDMSYAIRESVEEIMLGGAAPNSFAESLVAQFVDEVNWQEIAEHYFQEIEDDEEY